MNENDTSSPVTAVEQLANPQRPIYMNREQKRRAKRMLKLPGKVPADAEARWVYLKRKGHLAAEQYGRLAAMIRKARQIGKAEAQKQQNTETAVLG